MDTKPNTTMINYSLVKLVENPFRLRASNWSEPEITALLGFWRTQTAERDVKQLLRTRVIYEEISECLTAMGYHRTWEQCKEKMKKLKKEYYKFQRFLRSRAMDQQSGTAGPQMGSVGPQMESADPQSESEDPQMDTKPRCHFYNLLQLALEPAQQIRHGQMQMSGGAVRHPGPSPQFQQRPRMSAPSATVTSAPPAKRPRMDAPPPRPQMTGGRPIMQRSAMDADRKPRMQMAPHQQLRPPPRQFQAPPPPQPPRVPRQTQRTTMRSPQHQTSADEVRQSPESLERSFRNPDHSSHIMTQLSALWKSGRFVDAAILVGEVKLQAHRMVLFAASPYLRASFDNLNPSTELRLKMPSDIKLDVVFQFLTYLYDGVLRLNTDNAAPLLKVSLMLRMEHLTMCCREFMAQAVKQGLMPPVGRNDVVPPLLVLVDHRPPDTGGSKADMCTQTTSSGSEQEIPSRRPCVEFERVFGEGDGDGGRVHGATQFNGSLDNIQSDVDMYRNYQEESSRGGDSGMKAVHTQNDDDNDDEDAMPMMIIKNEHIDPGYELSLNPQHSDSENEDSVSQTSQEAGDPEQTSPTTHSNSDIDHGTDAVSAEAAGVVSEESVPNTDPGDGVSEVLQTSKTRSRSSSSSHTPEPIHQEPINQDSTSQSGTKSDSKDDNVSSEIGNDSRTVSETNRTDPVDVNKTTSGGTETVSNDDSAVFKHSNQSLPVGQSCDQSPPQFGTEEFLSSDFDSPTHHPAKTEPEEPA